MRNGWDARAWRAFAGLALFLMPVLAGCTGIIGPPEPSARMSADRESINAGESVNFDARETSTPDGTIITGYTWDFGDGITSETTQGYASHLFDTPGIYEVKVTATNDQGGEDHTFVTVYVNGFPEISLSMPVAVRCGDIVELDASGSSDPEGGVLTYRWDLDWSADADGDGDPRNDADESGAILTLAPEESRNMSGGVTVIDDQGASITRGWNLNVLPRAYQIVWEERRISFDWDGHLKQGNTEEILFEPGALGRLMAINATLTLAMDIIPGTMPQDNFTLELEATNDRWSDSARTSQENITKNSSANIWHEDLNPWPGLMANATADSADILLERLLNQTGARFGQGDWRILIEAEQADPDFIVDGIDPDDGNDWELTIDVIVLVPRISEVGV